MSPFAPRGLSSSGWLVAARAHQPAMLVIGFLSASREDSFLSGTAV
jgi:hypothetical protein